MDLEIELSDEVAAGLKEMATARGVTEEQVALEALRWFLPLQLGRMSEGGPPRNDGTGDDGAD